MHLSNLPSRILPPKGSQEGGKQNASSYEGAGNCLVVVVADTRIKDEKKQKRIAENILCRIRDCTCAYTRRQVCRSHGGEGRLAFEGGQCLINLGAKSAPVLQKASIL